MNESFLSVVETRRFLGREFLTWLVERLEEHGGRIEIDSDAVDLALGDRVVLEAGGDPGARLTLVDEGDLRPELGVGLRRGKLLDRARISISRGERRWELTLDGGLLTYDSLRCPKLGPRDGEATDDRRAAFENDLFLRLADIEDAIEKFGLARGADLDALSADFEKLAKKVETIRKKAGSSDTKASVETLQKRVVKLENALKTKK